MYQNDYCLKNNFVNKTSRFYFRQMPIIVKECLLGLNFLAPSSEEMSKKKYTKVKGKRNLKITSYSPVGVAQWLNIGL